MCRENEAVACFNKGFNCSQAVFSTYCEQLGLNKETALKISCSFGAGMGRMAETCGAVTGAFMLIGLKYGKYLEKDMTSKGKTYELVQEFSDRFRQIHGSIKCKELLKCDISTPEGMKFAQDNGYWDTYCVKYVEDASRIIENLLEL